jgi:hypothetical protein
MANYNFQNKKIKLEEDGKSPTLIINQVIIKFIFFEK